MTRKRCFFGVVYIDMRSLLFWGLSLIITTAVYSSERTLNLDMFCNFACHTHFHQKMAVVFHLVYFFLGSDKLFPAFGFGAQVPPNFQVRCSYFLRSNMNVFSMQVIVYYSKDVKGYFTQVWRFCHKLHSFKLFQTCLNFLGFIFGWSAPLKQTSLSDGIT